VIEKTETLREEHDAVLNSLGARRSTLHLAHAAVSGFVSLTFLAVGAKTWWDYSEYDPEYYQGSLIIAAAAGLYSAVRLIIGRGHFKRERVALRRLLTLRRELGVDDPSVMLPN
jgi:cytochrome bd-type quinol oxidase subunit 1